MLAQNFKTPEELNLTEKGYVGLLKVLRMLESGELAWTNGAHVPNGFNMTTTWVENECGTVGCIGGWAGFYNKDGWVPGMTLTAKSTGLFCPANAGPWETITVDRAAKAVRSFLVTGEADWGLD